MTRWKAAVIVLSLLATAKVATQEYLFRGGTREALIQGYRERAIAACQKDPRNQGLLASAAAWARPGEVKIVIGKSDIDVWFWQVDHSLWNARYRNPYLLLTSGDRFANVQCEYDIVHGVASVTRG